MLDRTDVSVKVKRPPAKIVTKAQAAEAFERVRRYYDAAAEAEKRMHWGSPGGNPFYKHQTRRDLYYGAADEWSDKLREWFQTQ